MRVRSGNEETYDQPDWFNSQTKNTIHKWDGRRHWMRVCIFSCLTFFLTFFRVLLSLPKFRSVFVVFAGVNQMGSNTWHNIWSGCRYFTRYLFNGLQSCYRLEMICNLYDCNWALIRTLYYFVIINVGDVEVAVATALHHNAIFPLFWLTGVASHPIKKISGNKFMMCHHFCTHQLMDTYRLI